MLNYNFYSLDPDVDSSMNFNEPESSKSVTEKNSQEENDDMFETVKLECLSDEEFVKDVSQFCQVTQNSQHNGNYLLLITILIIN